MKKNIINKNIVLIILILFLATIMITISSNAFEGDFSSFEADKSNENITDVIDVVDKIGANVITIIRIVSVTIALVMLLVIAMRYMISAPGDRADIKKHAVVYVVGAVILFGVSGILTILLEFSKNITPNKAP